MRGTAKSIILSVLSFSLCLTVHAVGNKNQPIAEQCDPNPCGEHGGCVPEEFGAYYCDCDPFWTGPLCDTTNRVFITNRVPAHGATNLNFAASDTIWLRLWFSEEMDFNSVKEGVRLFTPIGAWVNPSEVRQYQPFGRGGTDKVLELNMGVPPRSNFNYHVTLDENVIKSRTGNPLAPQEHWTFMTACIGHSKAVTVSDRSGIEQQHCGTPITGGVRLTDGTVSCDFRQGFYAAGDACTCDTQLGFISDGAAGCQCDTEAGWVQDAAAAAETALRCSRPLTKLKLHIQVAPYSRAGIQNHEAENCGLRFKTCPAQGDCFEAAYPFDPLAGYEAGFKIDKGSHLSMNFSDSPHPQQKRMISVNNEIWDDLVYPWDFQYMELQNTCTDDIHISGIKVEGKIESGANAGDWFPIYLNPMLNRRIQGGAEPLVTPMSLHDAAFAVAVETCDQDWASTDDPVLLEIYLQRPLDQFSLAWLSAYLATGSPLALKHEQISSANITLDLLDSPSTLAPTSRLLTALDWPGFSDYRLGRITSYYLTLYRGAESLKADDFGFQIISGNMVPKPSGDEWQICRVRAYAYWPGIKPNADGTVCQYYESNSGLNYWLSADPQDQSDPQRPAKFSWPEGYTNLQNLPGSGDAGTNQCQQFQSIVPNANATPAFGRD